MYEKFLNLPFGGGEAALYLPEDVGERKLPVLYVQDAEFLQEPLLLALNALPKRLQIAAVCVSAKDRDAAYTPWPAPAVFINSEGFPGGMDEFLPQLEALHAEMKSTPHVLQSPFASGILGYSLSGLLPLYALAKSEDFAVAAAISASLWFEGFVPFLLENPPLSGAHAYLTLGEKEPNAKNEVLRTVGTCHESLAAFYADKLGSKNSFYALTPGGHQSDVQGRVKNAVRWCAEHFERE